MQCYVTLVIIYCIMLRASNIGVLIPILNCVAKLKHTFKKYVNTQKSRVLWFYICRKKKQQQLYPSKSINDVTLQVTEKQNIWVLFLIADCLGIFRCLMCVRKWHIIYMWLSCIAKFLTIISWRCWLTVWYFLI